jgi:hypothetical protein
MRKQSIYTAKECVTYQLTGPTCFWPFVCSLLLETEGCKQGAGFAQGFVGCEGEPGVEVLHRLVPVPLQDNIWQ